MARTIVALQASAAGGLNPSLTDCVVAGMQFQNPNGDVILYASNTGAGNHVLTITTPGTVGGIGIADPAVTMAAGSMRIFGPFDRDVFNNADGYIYADTDGTYAELKLAAVLLTKGK
jgi:hypothetical protein